MLFDMRIGKTRFRAKSDRRKERRATVIQYDKIKPGTLTEVLNQAKANAKKKELELRKDEPAVNVYGIRPVTFKPEEFVLPTAAICDFVHRILRHWARWENPHWIDLAALWIVHTWFTDTDDRLMFANTARLFAIAPKGSGKTRIGQLVNALSREGTGIVKGVTFPGARDAILAGATLILDEADRVFGRGMRNLDLQTLISAYEADTVSLNGKNGGYNRQAIFGPVMLMSKPAILTTTNENLEDLFERSFIITPRKFRPTPADPEIPELGEDFTRAVTQVRRLLKTWSASVRNEADENGKLWPIHKDWWPAGMDSRMKEISRPLLTVADRAVDPGLIKANGSDVRWALRGRNAVANVLLGHGTDGKEIIAEVTRMFKEMGIEE